MDREDIALARQEAELERLELLLEERKKEHEEAEAQAADAHTEVVAGIKDFFASALWRDFVRHEEKILHCLRHKDLIPLMDRQASYYKAIVAMMEYAVSTAKLVCGVAENTRELTEMYSYDPAKEEEIVALTADLRAANDKIDKAMEAAAGTSGVDDAPPRMGDPEISE
nr:hypothetical protein B0A51_00349 [Rachicladosporium sp. CCFEE 5018]